MKRVVVSLACVLAGAGLAFGQASDRADNAVYATDWQTGYNGGSGFGAWSLVAAGANHGYFSMDSSADIRTSDHVWGLYANTGETSEGTRPFSTALQIGQTFRINFENGNVDAAGPSVGIGLQNATAQNRFEFYFAGGSANYTVNDNAGAGDSGIGWRNTGMTVSFTLTGANSYAWDVSAYGGSSLNSGSGTLANSGDIDRMHVWNFNAGAGADANFYVNDMQIIPEPSTMALLGIGLGGMLLRRRRQKAA